MWILREFADVSGQPGLISRCRISMNYTLVYCFIDQRDRRIQELGALVFIVPQQRRSQFFDLRAQLASVIAVDLFASRILSDAFLC